MSQQLGLSEVLCRVIINRGITTKEDIDSYLHAFMEKLHDPKLMKNMEKTVDIILEKIDTEKMIRIVSDYDVDGIISCYILYTALIRCKAKVDFYIPHRVSDGYGINEDIVKKAYEEGIDTIITCDNGIAASDPISTAKVYGMTVIITDHHEVPYSIDDYGNKIFKIPPADYILNPKQQDCTYPFKDLCGAGVVFKLVQALYKRLQLPDDEIYEFLQFLSIATVCDIVDLVGENRIIVKQGLQQLNHTSNTGLRALFKVNDLHNKSISTYTLGFIIGPCLNAAGRLDYAQKALSLLLSEDPKLATTYAQELYKLNRDRKELTEKGLEEVLSQVESSIIKSHKVKVIYNKLLHESVIGIIAGRIKDIYHHPVIVLTKSEKSVKGSGRSIEKYHLYDELSCCTDLLDKFGGHAMAAGLSIQETNIPLLVERLNSRFNIDDEDLIPILYIDVLLPINEVNKEFINQLEILEPFGKGNAKPIFGDKNVKISHAKYVGKAKKILKFKLISKNGEIKDAILFNNTDFIIEYLIKKWGKNEVDKIFLGQYNIIKVDIAYYPKINTYMGNESVQIQLQHLK